MLHIGIDFGAKKSGKTVACFRIEDRWHLAQSRKDEDADAFIQAIVSKHPFSAVFIDAPLSLPSVYTGGPGTDYFYRHADREASAMSPMFLGGLTARAIRLRDSWQSAGLKVYEAYPAGLVRELQIQAPYKADLAQFQDILRQKTGIDVPLPANWHQADALLAWITGNRTMENSNITLGKPGEGLIFI